MHVCRSMSMCGSVLGVEWAIIRNKDRQETFLHHRLCLRGGERKEEKRNGVDFFKRKLKPSLKRDRSEIDQTDR